MRAAEVVRRRADPVQRGQRGANSAKSIGYRRQQATDAELHGNAER